MEVRIVIQELIECNLDTMIAVLFNEKMVTSTMATNRLFTNTYCLASISITI